MAGFKSEEALIIVATASTVALHDKTVLLGGFFVRLIYLLISLTLMSPQKIKPEAPFDLRNQNSYFGSWPVLTDTDEEYAIVITFPVEGWQESAAAVVSQDKNGHISAESYGTTKYSEQAVNQALATLSLNIDDHGWQTMGKHDKFIAELQKKYNYLRPILFHSPYEAAVGFVIGQRISIKQRQAIQLKMADQLGQKIKVNNKTFAAFPLPQKLLELMEFPGLNETKVERLRGVAQAALDGSLNRNKLLDMSEEAALDYLQSLPGIGPFYASGILYRGAGIVDGVTDDSLTKYAIQQAYSLDSEPTQAKVLEIAENWKPFRMWCEVLIHIWLRREVGMPQKNSFQRK